MNGCCPVPHFAGGLVAASGRALAKNPTGAELTQRALRARRVEGRLLLPGRSVGMAGGGFLSSFRQLGG
jgi:hypothetical protein